jgi:SAM-dependent methyltransferase
MSGHFGGNPYSWASGANSAHIARYFLARGWVMPGETVLDAACATGYGSHLIGQVAEKVIGIDMDEGCISDAHGRWGKDNIDFRVGDLNKIEWPDADVLISIESFEHFNDFEYCLAQARKHIKRVMIITVPLGGTSHTYTKEELKLPAGENNDFNNVVDFESKFANDDWKCHTVFEFGYSGFGIFYKQPPKLPDGYDENGYKIGQVMP